MSPEVKELVGLIESAGLCITLDRRRYARAARSWPDYLPPMFPEHEVKREMWTPNKWGQWVRFYP